MNTPLRGFIVVALITLSARAAEEAFTRALTPADFAAAGLNKLTPDEITRLDTLVRDYQSGTLAAAQREVAAAQAKAAQAEAESRAALAKSEELQRAQPKNTESWLGKAKAILTPGTKVEYQPLESKIVGTIKGWEKRTVFHLENGDMWRVTDSDSYWSPTPLENPTVRITPGSFGDYWMKIEGIGVRVRVAPIVAK